jgi:hypothetical protein
MDWIELAQDGDFERAVVVTKINLVGADQVN